MTKTTTAETVKEAFLNGNGTVIDNHSDKPIEVAALLVFTNGAVGQFVQGARYQCINEIYLSTDDNKLHLSTTSIGGVIMGRNISHDTIEEYNESQLFKGRRCNKVIFFNGDEWEFNVED